MRGGSAMRKRRLLLAASLLIVAIGAALSALLVWMPPDPGRECFERIAVEETTVDEASEMFLAAGFSPASGFASGGMSSTCYRSGSDNESRIVIDCYSSSSRLVSDKQYYPPASVFVRLRR